MKQTHWSKRWYSHSFHRVCRDKNRIVFIWAIRHVYASHHVRTVECYSCVHGCAPFMFKFILSHSNYIIWHFCWLSKIRIIKYSDHASGQYLCHYIRFVKEKKTFRKPNEEIYMKSLIETLFSSLIWSSSIFFFFFCWLALFWYHWILWIFLDCMEGPWMCVSLRQSVIETQCDDT